MKIKRNAQLLLLGAALFILCGCSDNSMQAVSETAAEVRAETVDATEYNLTLTNSDEPETAAADGAEVLTGIWKVGAVMIDGEKYEFESDKTIAPIYETYLLSIFENGIYKYLNPLGYVFEGHYERTQKSGTDDFLFFNEESYFISAEGATGREEINDELPDYYISAISGNRIIVGEFDEDGQIDKSSIFYFDLYTKDDKETVSISESHSTGISEKKPDNGNPADITMGQKNALQKAHLYLNTTAFSYQGLVEQLEYEGYTTAEATYAAMNCGADWKAQAAKKAELYLEIMPFSRQSLKDQLLYDGFTSSEAEYGVSVVYK